MALMATLVLEFEGVVFEGSRIFDFKGKSKHQKSFFLCSTFFLAERGNLIASPVPYSLVVLL